MLGTCSSARAAIGANTNATPNATNVNPLTATFCNRSICIASLSLFASLDRMLAEKPVRA
jgi:hypothetical protein